MGQDSQISFPSLGKLEDELPTAEWTTEQLGRYAQCQDDLCTGLARKMAVHRFREGHALTLAYERIDYGGWTAFLTKHNISHSSANRARKLYAKAKDEKNLDGLTIMDAYEEFEIDRPESDRSKQRSKGKSPKKQSSARGQTEQVKSVPQHNGDESKLSVAAMTIPEETPEVDDASEVDRILQEFNAFAAARGWDDGRKIQVMAELSFSDPVQDMVQDLVAAGSGDEVLAQLHQYYGDEPDLWSLFVDGKAKPDQVMPAINAKIEELKRTLTERALESKAGLGEPKWTETVCQPKREEG